MIGTHFHWSISAGTIEWAEQGQGQPSTNTGNLVARTQQLCWYGGIPGHVVYRFLPKFALNFFPRKGVDVLGRARYN